MPSRELKNKLWYGKLDSSENEQSKTTCNSVNLSDITLCDNPDTKEHTVYDYIYIKYKGRQTNLCC